MLKTLPMFALALMAPAPSSSQELAQDVRVTLSSFDFAPAELRLPSGEMIHLILVNDSSGGHDFSAPEFFAAAKVDPQSAKWIRRGKVEVPSGKSVTIKLVPAKGTYRLKCSHFAHAMMGMTGTITVE